MGSGFTVATVRNVPTRRGFRGIDCTLTLSHDLYDTSVYALIRAGTLFHALSGSYIGFSTCSFLCCSFCIPTHSGRSSVIPSKHSLGNQMSNSCLYFNLCMCNLIASDWPETSSGRDPEGGGGTGRFRGAACLVLFTKSL